METILERFLRYVAVDTQSNEESESQPSAMKELDLLKMLRDELKAMGIKVVEHKTELNMLELNADRLQNLRHEILGDVPKAKAAKPVEGLPTRPPVLCAGCGHRGVFYVLHKLGARRKRQGRQAPDHTQLRRQPHPPDRRTRPRTGSCGVPGTA